jgi:branched-chain amino acid transport system substrate-binding protein
MPPTWLLALVPLVSACSGGSAPVVFGFALQDTTNLRENTQFLAAELAVSEINAAGGAGGRPVGLRVKQDGADAAGAIAVADEFVNDDEVLAVVGHNSSAKTLAAGPVYQRGLVAMTITATSDEIRALGPWVFRLTSSDSLNAQSRARQLLQVDRRIAQIYLNNEFGRNHSQRMQRAFEALGGTVIRMDPLLAETRDFAPYLRRLMMRDARVIGLSMGPEEAEPLIRQARALGYRGYFLGSSTLRPLQEKGPEFEGLIIPLPDAFDGEFGRRFQAAYPQAGPADFDAAAAHDAVRLFAAAVAAGNHSRASIRGYLERVGRPSGLPAFTGSSGTIRFDADGDRITGVAAPLGVVRGSRLVPLAAAR